jgi:hypothetical protein
VFRPQRLTYRSLLRRIIQEKIMFASLEEQMKRDDAKATSPRERIAKWAMIVFVAVAVFGGLYFAVHPFALILD